MVNLKERL